MQQLAVLLIVVAASMTAVVAWPQYATTGLTKDGANATLTATSQQNDPTVYATLALNIRAIGDDVLGITIAPQALGATQEAYRVPDEVFPRSTGVAPASRTSSKLTATLSSNGVVTVTQIDGPAGKPMFSIDQLQFGPNYLAFTSALDAKSTFLSGYGEHQYYYFINKDVREGASSKVELSLWNTDNGTPWQNPMYGVHPVIFVADPANAWYYAFVVINSHAQRLTITSGGLQWYFIGGELEAYIITGTTMEEVIKRYHTTVIRPSYIPPYWSLGTHQCRWGYKNLSDVKSVVAGYANADLPLEVMWNDIDYMDKFRIFTTDPTNYPAADLKEFVATLHANGQHYVQIIDPGVAQADYPVFWSGLNQSVYVNRSAAQGGGPLVNVVWPGWTVFPDFTSDRVGAWWQGQLQEYFKTIALDGVWLDMNELGVFCEGQCQAPIGTPWTWQWLNCNWTELNIQVCGTEGHCSAQNSSLNFPDPMPLTNGWQLPQHTIDMTAELSMGRYYDTKAFYGLMEERQSFKALSALRPNTRPFLLSRASFLGSGAYTAHWTGDNRCAWGPREGGLADSIQGVLGANLWGISQVGADIGGFDGQPEQQLLTRWTQLGAFYSFMRNHHGLDDSPGQEPYRFEPKAVDAMRRAMRLRYQLLPYLFSALVDSHYYGGPVLKHPSVAFPNDEAAYREMYSFMFGSAVYVLPVVQPNVSAAEGYLPAGTWYNLWALTGALTQYSATPIAVGPIPVWRPASPLYTGDIPAYLVAGTALPFHTTALNTVIKTRLSGTSLLCALDKFGAATGHAAFDDGFELPMPSQASLSHYVDYQCQFSGTFGTVVASPRNNASYTPLTGAASNVVVWFTSVTPTAALTSAVSVNGVAVASYAVSADTTLGYSRVTVQLPAGIDATSPFVLMFGAPGATKSSASASDKDPIGLPSSDILVVAGSGVLLIGLTFIMVATFRRSRAERQAKAYSNDEMLTCH